MKRTFRKILCTLLVVVMCLTSAPLSGFVGLDFTGEAVNYKVGDIVQFGSYPQSKVTDSATITVLNNKAPAWDNWTSYGYYSGTGDYGTMKPGDWMRYTDITYNGNKYRGVKFTQYRPFFTFKSSSFDTYQDDNGYRTNTVYWFKFEPIDWRILDPATGLVMCETIIDSQPYSNTIYKKGSGGTYGYFNDASYTNYASDYETSSVREWLNNDFYNTAFTDSEKEEINTTTLNNDGYYTSVETTGYEKLDSNSTNDKIFLLSYNEVLNSDFGFNSSSSAPDPARFSQGSDYAKCQGLYVQIKPDHYSNNNSYWVLRSPGGSSDYCCGVKSTGRSNFDYGVYRSLKGIRPAFYFNLIRIVDRTFYRNIDYYTTYTNSSVYNPELSNMTAALSKAVYNETDIENAYTSLGFYTDDENDIFYDYSGEFNPYRCGHTIGLKKSIYNDEYICLVVVRGSVGEILGGSDWTGNFSIATTDDGKHIGFAYPANYIYQNIKNLLNSKNIIGNVKYVITGHSRGAAVANLLAVQLMERGVSSSNIYNYNFACPDVACKVIFNSYNNIFNLCNREDPVPFVPGNLASTFTTPGTSWGKYGNTYWFTKDAGGTINPFSDHDIDLYLEFFDQKLDTDEWDYTLGDLVDDINYILIGWKAKILCPVDVIITDVEGNKIASVIDGEVNYYNSSFGDVIILTDGDKKVVYVNGDRDFNINLVGTDDGTMMYSVEKYNLATGETTELKEFSNVKLEKGKEMYSPVSVAEKTSDIQLFVVEELNGESINSYEINADGSETEINHIYKSNVQLPTCTLSGFTTYICSCGDSYTDNEVPANGHTDSKWIIDKASSCSAEGSKHIECTVCGEVLKTESIAKLPHNYSSVIKEATCETGGYTTYTCTCGYTYTGDKTSAKGHDYAEGVCKNCGDSKIDNCSCNCHKSGFMGFIWKIINFFNKLFKSNKICACGIAHY